MEADFVNVYIGKQKALIEDLLAKNIMLETKLSVAETTAAKYRDDVSAITAEMEEKNKYINKLVDQVSKLQLASNQREETRPAKKKKEAPAEEVIAADEF